MKKLYRKGAVHPSPPIISDQLSFLPATILTLTAALSPEDREVLAYLISCSSSNNTFSGNPRRSTTAENDGDHAPLFSCSCFRCYMSYWVRWDSSPNRQLIHEIIDAFEEWLAQKGGKKKNNNNGGRKEKRNKRGSNRQPAELTRNELAVSSESTESTESESVVESSGNKSVGEGGERVEEEEKGSVRRFMSFIGERIWGAWGQ